MESVLNGRTVATGFEIDKIRYVTGGDAQGEWTPLNRSAVEELRVGDHRGDSGELVDGDFCWWLVAENSEQHDSGIVAAALVSSAATLAFTLAGISWPKIELLNEKDHVREGFLSAEQMTRLLAALPDDGLRDYVEFCWCTGMRKSEAASLRWSFIHDGRIVVPQEFCKSRKPHVIPIAGPLAAILKRREAARSFQLNGIAQLCEFVFHRDGESIREFRKTWKTATAKVAVGNILFHDLRRSAVRDLIRAGVSQSVAMKISGHRTAAIFQRYDIVVGDDLKPALEKNAQYRMG